MTFQTKQQSSCLRIVFGHLLASAGFAIEQKPINTVMRSIQQNETEARFVLSHEPVVDSSHSKAALSQRTSKSATLALLSFEEKVIKTAHARAHFLHAILSQINGNVIESVHVLYFMQRKLYYRWILF